MRIKAPNAAANKSNAEIEKTDISRRRDRINGLNTYLKYDLMYECHRLVAAV